MVKANVACNGRRNCCCEQLLDTDVHRRLGMALSPYGLIRRHTFFCSIDWVKLEQRQVEPPFKPVVVSYCVLNLIFDASLSNDYK
jgi:hypothetical protein